MGDLQTQRSQLTVNQGRTAEDLIERYWRSEQRLATIIQQCEAKSNQCDRVADAVNHLRDRLTEIAQSGNKQIDDILSGNSSTEAKVAAVNAVITEKNADAANAGVNAMANVIDATQRVLDATIGGDARKWLRDHGVNLDGPPPSRPVTAADLNASHAPTSPETSAFGADRPAPGTSVPGADASPPGSAFGGNRPGPGAPQQQQEVTPMPSTALAFGGDQSAPKGPSLPNTVEPNLPPSLPPVGLGGTSLPGISTPGATGIPAAASAPLSPQSLSQSFTTGMMTGAPAAAGAQSLSEGTIHAATEPLAPTTPPATAPIAAAPAMATGAAAVPHVPDMSAAAAPTPVVSPTAETGMTTVAPVVAGGP
ncbi:hypothetical protein, partial [Mycobacterium kansasii]|uniref:hypothetical protein n=1 Tax=Mycobacterium kansasii TaxID=1768 RepID=UPI0016052811